MANFINKYSDLAAWKADQNRDYPNIAYLEQEDMVKWTPEKPETRVFCTYNVTTTSSDTILLYTNLNVSGITKMYIDDVEQESVVKFYRFSTTGEHTVKYEMGNSIGRDTFYNCYNLLEVIIPDNITTIDLNAFRHCSGLTSITIPDTVTSIGSNAFLNCKGMTSTSIDSASIGGYAFNGCTSLTSVTFGSGVTSIGDNAFNGCTGLTTVNIPDNVTNINQNAFRQCSSLTTVSIGSGITNLGAWAFGNNNTLTDFTIRAVTPPTTSSPFISVTSDFTIYVPSASVNAYKAAGGWSAYASRIQAIQ